MGRWVFGATLILVALCPTGANAARTLLADLMAHASAEAGGETMSALVLEACLRRARELDNTGTTIDYEIAAIDREAAEGVFLQNQLNAELPSLGDYDEPALEDFQRRVVRHQQLAKKFQMEFPIYEDKQRVYEAAVTEFEHSCAGNFSHKDLEAVKSKLDLK
jgi:hypothetical protein